MPEAQILSKHERGAWAEVYAAQWLIERGYYVSRNIAHAAPFDLVATSQSGHVVLFDVKYVSYKGRRRDATTYRVLSPLQKVMKVHLFVIDNEGNVSVDPPLNGPEEEPESK
jgi:Holliday junction resolvase-like predicted endonuclease